MGRGTLPRRARWRIFLLPSSRIHTLLVTMAPMETMKAAMKPAMKSAMKAKPGHSMRKGTIAEQLAKKCGFKKPECSKLLGDLAEIGAARLRI